MDELKRFFKARWVELLIAGVWLQSVVSAAFTGSLVLLALTTLGGLALLIVVFWLVGTLRRHRSPAYGDSEAFVTPRQAVVFTVGRQPHTILFALQSQKPTWLGLICSRETEATADDIRAKSGLEDGRVQKEIVDPWSVIEVREKLAFVFDWLARQGVKREEIVLDITGGTAIMSAGAFSLAVERQVDCQYVRSDYDAENRPIPNTQRAVFVARHVVHAAASLHNE